MDNAILDIEAIRARHAAATKGPYRYSGKSGDGKRQFIESTGDDDGWHLLRAEVDSDDCDYDEAVNNAIFLAASWQDVADLIAEVERLRAEVAALKLTAKHLPAQTVAPFSETEMGKWIAEQSKRPPPNVHIGGNESLIPKE